MSIVRSPAHVPACPRRCALSLILPALACVLTVCPSPGRPPAIRYQHRSAAGPLSVHVLEVDPARSLILADRALSDGAVRKSASSMATPCNPAAAVSGGSFRIGGQCAAEPWAIPRVGGRWHSDSATTRGAVGWKPGGRNYPMGRLKMEWKLLFRGFSLPIDGINRPGGSQEAILNKWGFHRNTLTDPVGLDWILAGGKVRGVTGGGSAPISESGNVFSVGPVVRPSTPVAVGARPGFPAIVIPDPFGEGSIVHRFRESEPERWRAARGPR